jgi:hypothetical protein
MWFYCALAVSCLVLTGCAAGGSAGGVRGDSQQGVVNVDEVAPQLAGLVEDQRLSDERIQHAVAAVVDQRTQNVWNDVRPWITGAVVTVAIVAAAAVVVLVVWIRWNSYLRQKPVYERGRVRQGW